MQRLDRFKSYVSFSYDYNFNKNFSKGGEFEIYAKDIGYDENNPITEDDFVYRLDKINLIVSKWCDIAEEEDENINDATRRLDE